MKDPQPTAAEILDERISDANLSQAEARYVRERKEKLLDAAAIAIPCVMRAAHEGNVQCKEALREINKILYPQ